MFFRLLTILFFASLFCIGTLYSHTISKADENPESSNQTSQNLIHLTKTASIIVIAEVQPETPLPVKSNTNEPANIKIDIQKEFDKAREETAYSSTGLNVGSTIRLKTLETLKGPQTQILLLPTTHQDFKSAASGDLFVVMMGSNHPDAIKAISSVDDLWVQQVKAAISN